MNQMRFKAFLNGDEHLITVKKLPNTNTYQVILDGESHIVDAAYIRPGCMNFLIDDKSVDVYLQATKAGNQIVGEDMFVHLDGRKLRLEILEESRQKLLQAQKPSGTKSVGARVLSPMPGKIIRLLVEEGQRVEIGQGLVVIEAMKMENELKALQAGLVSNVRLKPGDTLESGALLMELSNLI